MKHEDVIIGEVYWTRVGTALKQVRVIRETIDSETGAPAFVVRIGLA